MTVYNINLGIGWASSGVEYAQAYRAKIFKEMGQEAKFVFMDLILGDNIEHMTSKIGFSDDEIIWLHPTENCRSVQGSRAADRELIPEQTA